MMYFERSRILFATNKYLFLLLLLKYNICQYENKSTKNKN